jgi:hypothetical protein
MEARKQQSTPSPDTVTALLGILTQLCITGLCVPKSKIVQHRCLSIASNISLDRSKDDSNSIQVKLNKRANTYKSIKAMFVATALGGCSDISTLNSDTTYSLR